MTHRSKILAVDDEPHILDALKSIFMRDCDVVTATNGLEALAVYKEQLPDIVITDQRMPHLTGVEFIARLRSEGYEPIALLLTAHRDVNELVDAINDAHFFRMISKPWKLNALRAAVSAAIEQNIMNRERVRVWRAATRRAEALSIFQEVLRESTGEKSDTTTVVRRLLPKLGRVFESSAAAALIRTDETHASLEIFTAVHLDAIRLSRIKTRAASKYEELIGDSGALQNITVAIDASSATKNQAGGSTFVSDLATQIFLEGRGVGVVILLSNQKNAYDDTDSQVLDILSNQTASLLDHIKAYQHSSRQRAEYIIDSLPDAVLLLDEGLEPALSNRSARQLLRELYPDEGLRSGIKKMSGLLFSGSLIRNAVVRDIQCGARFFQVAITPLDLQTHGLRGHLLSMREITARTQRDHNRDAFLAIVSHELRTPLTGITGAIEYMVDQIKGVDQNISTKFLDLALEATSQLHRIIDELLDVSRASRGSLTMNPSQTSLAPVIAQAVDSFDAAFRKKSVHVEFHCDKDLPQLFIDGTRLRQVVQNVLANAVHHTSYQGHVKVALRRSSLVPQYVTLSVWNSGLGLAIEDAERIFNEFEQLRSADNREIHGSGLGLSICKTIVEAHNGHIFCDPQEGNGVTFVITLPTSNMPDLKRLGTGTSDMRSMQLGGAGNVVVFENDVATRWCLHARLAAAGYIVRSFETFKDALDTALWTQPATIVLGATLTAEARTRLHSALAAAAVCGVSVMPIVDCVLQSDGSIDIDDLLESVERQAINALEGWATVRNRMKQVYSFSQSLRKLRDENQTAYVGLLELSALGPLILKRRHSEAMGLLERAKLAFGQVIDDESASHCMLFDVAPTRVAFVVKGRTKPPAYDACVAAVQGILNSTRKGQPPTPHMVKLIAVEPHEIRGKASEILTRLERQLHTQAKLNSHASAANTDVANTTSELSKTAN